MVTYVVVVVFLFAITLIQIQTDYTSKFKAEI